MKTNCTFALACLIASFLSGCDGAKTAPNDNLIDLRAYWYAGKHEGSLVYVYHKDSSSEVKYYLVEFKAEGADTSVNTTIFDERFRKEVESRERWTETSFEYDSMTEYLNNLPGQPMSQTVYSNGHMERFQPVADTNSYRLESLTTYQSIELAMSQSGRFELNPCNIQQGGYTATDCINRHGTMIMRSKIKGLEQIIKHNNYHYARNIGMIDYSLTSDKGDGRDIYRLTKIISPAEFEVLRKNGGMVSMVGR